MRHVGFRKGALVAVVFLCSAAFVATSDAHPLRIWHFDVGQADSTLLITPTGTTVLFDCGETDYRSCTNAAHVANRIEELTGAKHIDWLVLSHLHADHAGYVEHGGVWNLIEEQHVSIGTILTGDISEHRGDISDNAWPLWCEYMSSSDEISFCWDIRSVDSLEDTISLGCGVFLTLCSADGNGLLASTSTCSANDLSLGVVISYGEYQEWIGGDLSGVSMCGYKDIETYAAALIGDVEVLRVNHHGSTYSSNGTFLTNLDPEVSIVSVGETRENGHPARDVLERLAATSDVYVTTMGNSNGALRSGEPDVTLYSNLYPDSGDVLVTTNGSSFWINGREYLATTPVRVDRDGDGYFAEVDPDDSDPSVVPEECSSTCCPTPNGS